MTKRLNTEEQRRKSREVTPPGKTPGAIGSKQSPLSFRTRLTKKAAPAVDDVFDFNDEQLKRKSNQAWGAQFFETQIDCLCGIHSLNNIVGGPFFDRGKCTKACAEVISITNTDPADHMSKSGDYSTSVLQMLFDTISPPLWRMLTRHVQMEDWINFTQNEDVMGILVNIEERHWVCIKKVHGKVFYIDPCHWPRLLTRREFDDVITVQPAAFFVVKNESDLI